MKRYILRVSIIIMLFAIVAIGSNVKALLLRSIYLPLVVKSTPPPTAIPTITVTQPPSTTGNIEILDIYYDGYGIYEPDEFVVIQNDSSFPIQLKNWTLRDKDYHTFTFPSYVIEQGEICFVYTNELHPVWCGFNFASSIAIWDNSGDTAYLRNSFGILIDVYSYGGG